MIVVADEYVPEVRMDHVHPQGVGEGKLFMNWATRPLKEREGGEK